MSGGIKLEHDASPAIKADPDLVIDSAVYVEAIDDDVYEDTGELTIPPDFGAQNVWLSRVPKWLWEVLSVVEDEEELEIGKLMKWEEEEGGVPKSKLVLRRDLRRFKDVPKEYQVNTVNNNPTNTFVFSEKDLDGYNPNAYKRSSQQRGPSIRDGRINKFRRGRSKKPIPKNTSLAARSAQETTCIPIENNELSAFQAHKTAKSQKAANRLVLEHDLSKFTKLIGGTVSASSSSNVLHIANANKARQRAQDIKYARIPQNELLDMLLKLFQQYRYWPIKALKEKTLQPEAYLRETLVKIASLVRAGQFANTWVLNPEAEVANYADVGLGDVREEAAPEPEFGEEEGEEEEEDDEEDDGEEEEMVDVI